MSREIRPGIRRMFRLVTRRDHASDADNEIALHLKLRTQQLIDEGMSPADARAEAEQRFGPVDEERSRFQQSARKRERSIGVREWIDSVRMDVRYAMRTLRREFGFTAFAILIVGFGIGASATVYSLVNGVLLKPMPFKEPSRLIWISNIADDGISEWRLQVGHFVDLAARSTTLQDIAGYYAYYRTGDAVMSSNGESQRLTQVPVTCNFLPFLGIAPLIGRSFAPDECLNNSARAVVLTEAMWRRKFAGDPAIVGRVITINDQPTTIIGVVPASFDFASVFAPGTNVDMLSPFPLSEENNRRGNTLAAIGRIKPGVPVERARTELVGTAKQLSEEFKQRNTIRAKILPLDERVNGRVKPALFVLSTAVLAVMLIVSANLSSLQFARIAARRRELAVRTALGAARSRLIRQAFTESLVLTSLGALLGIALTYAGTRAVSQLSTFDIPLLARVNIDIGALAIIALLTVVTGVLVGVLPALFAPVDVNSSLKDGNRGTTRGGHARVRSVLVVSEVAVACVLLVASGLLIRSFVRVLDVDLGFSTAQTLSMRVDPSRRFTSDTVMVSYYDEVLRSARAARGVNSVALSSTLPFGGESSWGIGAEDQVYERGQMPEGFVRFVSDGYFRTMGIPVRVGRDFSESDTREAMDVVAINETLARRLWPGRDAIGRRIRNGRRPVTVIGVVGDARHNSLENESTGEIYYAMRQFPDYSRLNLVVRTELPRDQLTSSMRSALATAAPDAARNEWTPLQTLVDKATSPRRFVVIVLGGFAAFALMLAALGIYALISYGVHQRRQEIGIRMALGATTGNVRFSIMRGTFVLAIVGITIGVVASMALVPSINSMLFGVTSTDPVSYAIAFALLAVAALAAGYFPARRATRVDPGVALRDG